MEEQPTSLITRACDMCRRKKIRCEVTLGDCLQCTRYKTKCHFTPISMKRKPRRLVGDKRVEQLEKRLKWMEDQLKRSMETRQSGAKEARPEPQELQKPTSSQSQSKSYHTAHHTTQFTQPGNSLDLVFTSIGSSPNPTEFAGPSRNESPPTIPEKQISSSPWNITSISDAFVTTSFKVLPPKEEALGLIKKSFQGFNSALPLFDETAFLNTFDSMDWNMSDPGWWACLNVVLALTHRFEISTALDRDDDREAWGYFQNALAVMNQLTTMNSTISSVQALLGMSIAVMGTMNPTPASILISSAIKQAHVLGLHRQIKERGLSTAEIEQRRRVFWIAYCLDKDISLQTGLPPTQDDDDMDVDLPLENAGPPTRPGRQHAVGYFNYRVRLAVIQGQIYKRFCSVKATKQSVTERLMAAKELESMLQNWKRGVPAYLHRDVSRSNFHELTLKNISLPLGLQLPYFNSLAVMYNSLPIPAIMSSPSSYAIEASKTIELLQITPRGHNACIRAVLHIFVSATIALLKHTISNPSNPLALADLKLIEPLLKILHMLAQKDETEEILQMDRSCTVMFQRARQAVDRSNLERVRREERRIIEPSIGGKERVEDFLKRIEYISSGYDIELTPAPRDV